MGIKAPLTPFTDTNHTFTTTPITGGTQYELKGTLNDALGQVVIMDVVVIVKGNVVTVAPKITLNAKGFPIKTLGVFTANTTGTIGTKDSSGRIPVKSAQSNITYLVTPKTIPGITNTTPITAALNAMFKAKGLM